MLLDQAPAAKGLGAWRAIGPGALGGHQGDQERLKLAIEIRASRDGRLADDHGVDRPECLAERL